MMQVLADVMVPVARGLVRASWARQRWITFRYSVEWFEDMGLLLLLTMD
jgi:hypothetical protein